MTKILQSIYNWHSITRQWCYIAILNPDTVCYNYIMTILDIKMPVLTIALFTITLQFQVVGCVWKFSAVSHHQLNYHFKLLLAFKYGILVWRILGHLRNDYDVNLDCCKFPANSISFSAILDFKSLHINCMNKKNKNTQTFYCRFHSFEFNEYPNGFLIRSIGNLAKQTH